MIKLKHLVLALALVTALPASAAQIGAPAPAFSVQDTTGQGQTLEQYKGKLVVLEWNNPECPFVRKHYDTGNMQGLQQYAKDKGAVWLTINSGAPGKQGNLNAKMAADMLAKTKAVPTGYILDPEGKLGKLYGAKATPHMYVINTKGNLAYAGAIDDTPSYDKADIKTAKNYVRAAIDELNAGKPVTTASTTAYGCAVKYADE